MGLAAAAGRLGAYAYRKERVGVVTMYFFGSAAALMVVATVVLVGPGFGELEGACALAAARGSSVPGSGQGIS